MSIRLILLGFLQEKPLYGYEIKQLIEQRMGDWTDIKFGSIYFSLDKLAKDGFIDKTGEFAEGSRPKKIVYTINNRGREEFFRLVKALWTEKKQDFYHFDLAVYNMSFMPKEEVRALLKERIAWYDRSLKFLDDHEKEFARDPHIPLQAFAITDHSRVHMAAEKEWLQKLLNNLEDYY